MEKRVKTKSNSYLKIRKKRLLPTIKDKGVYKEYEKKKARREKCI